MSALTKTNPTFLDFAKSLDPDDKVADTIELLTQENEVLQTMVALEGNLLTGHQSSVRTGIPSGTWRKLYGGVQPSKTSRAVIQDTCGMLENYSEVDPAEVELNGNTEAFRLDESQGILEGMGQDVATATFYGNEKTNPAIFTGLAPRFSSLSAENATNILVGGSATQNVNTSIWLINTGKRKVHYIYPKGTKGGVETTDKGLITKQNIDGVGGMAEMYTMHFKWRVGLAVPDWRYVVRIPNIKVSTLTADGATGAKLIQLMTQALERIKSLQGGTPMFLCNRIIREYLRLQAVSAVSSSTLRMDEVEGQTVVSLGGVRIGRCDAIVNTEALVA